MCVIYPGPISVKQSIENAVKMYNAKNPKQAERFLDKLDRRLRKSYFSERGYDRRVKHGLLYALSHDPYKGPDRRKRIIVYEDNE